MNRFSGKVIVVTGGSGLLGAAMLEHIIREGGIGINADINVKDDIHNGLLRCDITDAASVDRVIALLLDKYQKIDGWVNNAYPRTEDWGNPFEEITSASWKKNVDDQLNAVFLCCQKITAVMKQQKTGSIVNMASIYGVVGPDFSVYEGAAMTMPAAYAAIKGGIINLSRYLASYYGSDNVRVNCVSPGGVFNNQHPDFIKQYIAKVPLKRMANPSDIASAVCFLLSDDAAYITGHNMMVDGGWTAV